MLKVHGGSIWKHEIKLMTCHFKQAAREKYLGYNSLECAGNILTLSFLQVISDSQLST